MKAAGYAAGEISTLTGLTSEQVERL